MIQKDVPKRNGSGQGRRANRGRGNCNPVKDRNVRKDGGGGRNRRR